MIEALDSLPPGPTSTLEGERIMLVLVGVVGSGKSTFAQDLEHALPSFRRCCQDNLGNRRAVENAARSALRNGLSVCVDRTNIDRSQRAHWIAIAQEFQVPCSIIVFDTPYEVCVQRLRARRDHPTIRDVKTGLRALSHFANTFEPPDPIEGYQQLLRLTLAEQAPAYSQETVLYILQKLRHPPSPGRAEQAHITQYFRVGGSSPPSSRRDRGNLHTRTSDQKNDRRPRAER